MNRPSGKGRCKTSNASITLLVLLGVVVLQSMTMILLQWDPPPPQSVILPPRPAELGRKALSKKRLFLGPIFFNIYIPPPSSNHSNVTYLLEILDEQFKVLSQQQHERRSSSVEVTLIGGLHDNHIDWTQRILQDCPSCRIRAHLEQGNEVHTLQALWDYCHRAGDDNPIVTYIHNKGSFHRTTANEIARRLGTAAALACRTRLVEVLQTKPHFCNVCTSQFQIIPQYLGNSNMWTATCAHVRRLLPPDTYAPAMEDYFWNVVQKGPICERPIAIDAPNHLGIGRYAYERWVWSHPNIQPCDIVHPKTTRPALVHSLDSSFVDAILQNLTRAPHKKPRQMGVQFGVMKSSFARLEGRLREWQHLYHAAPPNRSWVWRFYNQGGDFVHGSQDFLETCQKESMIHQIGAR